MTKKLEELFNLGPKDEDDIEDEGIVDDEVVTAAMNITSVADRDQAIKDIAVDLPTIRELEEVDDGKLDELARKAESAFEDLMDLGLNVEVRYSGRIFEVASSMLKNAIDAKTTRVDRKLRAIDLQIKKYKIDEANKPARSPEDFEGTARVYADRNELIKRLQDSSTDKPEEK